MPGGATTAEPQPPGNPGGALASDRGSPELVSEGRRVLVGAAVSAVTVPLMFLEVLTASTGRGSTG